MSVLTLNSANFLLLKDNSEQEIIAIKATIKDFFKVVKANPDKNFELIEGKIIAMSNASVAHNRIINNLGLLIGNHLLDNNSPCEFYSETNCKIDNYNCVQPDIAVVCHHSNNNKYLENPILVGEVLSSNKKDDLLKLERYKSCQSIQEILMIEQKKTQITHYQRNNDDWINHTYTVNDRIKLDSIDFFISVQEIYRAVKFSIL